MSALPVAGLPASPVPLLAYLECQYVLTFPSTALFQEPFVCVSLPLVPLSVDPAQLSAVADSPLVGNLLYPDSLVSAFHVQPLLASAVSTLPGTAPLVTIIPSAHAIATAFFMLFTFIFFLLFSKNMGREQPNAKMSLINFPSLIFVKTKILFVHKHILVCFLLFYSFYSA